VAWCLGGRLSGPGVSFRDGDGADGRATRGPACPRIGLGDLVGRCGVVDSAGGAGGSVSAGPEPVESPGPTGPGEIGGSSGTSMAPLVVSSSSDPAVIAARVGTDASPTSSATIATYRRVGARKPPAL
jgi:hypothetical protein